MLLSSVERDQSPNHTKQLEDVQDFTADYNVVFAMDHELEKLRMKEAEIELTSLISFLSLGSEEILIEKICTIWRRGNC